MRLRKGERERKKKHTRKKLLQKLKTVPRRSAHTFPHPSLSHVSHLTFLPFPVRLFSQNIFLSLFFIYYVTKWFRIARKHIHRNKPAYVQTQKQTTTTKNLHPHTRNNKQTQTSTHRNKNTHISTHTETYIQRQVNTHPETNKDIYAVKQTLKQTNKMLKQSQNA